MSLTGNLSVKKEVNEPQELQEASKNEESGCKSQEDNSETSEQDSHYQEEGSEGEEEIPETETKTDEKVQNEDKPCTTSLSIEPPRVSVHPASSNVIILTGARTHMILRLVAAGPGTTGVT